MTYDLTYICRTMGNLSGIPTRLYRKDQQVFFYSMVALPKDPIVLFEKEILALPGPVSYFATPTLNYYGIFRTGEETLVIGPTRHVPNSPQELRRMAFLADVPPEEVPDFISAMGSIVGLPLERLMQMLGLMYYLVEGKQPEAVSSIIRENQQEHIQRELVTDEAALPESVPLFYQKVDNTYSVERTLLDIVARGDTSALEEWLKTPTTVQNAPLAADPLRHRKNTLISTVTLASRSAITGGMSPGDAIALAGSYISRAELLNTPEAIVNLQYHALKAFTEQVNALRFGQEQSRLVTEVANYIRHHLSQPIKAQDIAEALFISRPYLSKKFKEEAGTSVTNFIRFQKIREAKRLLRYTDKSLLAISVYLGFSSQSHFTHTFKAMTGKNPREYREKTQA